MSRTLLYYPFIDVPIDGFRLKQAVLYWTK
jgi:hypothetical protein